jgi:four helix bundle protein
MEGGLQELEETIYWLELLMESQTSGHEEIQDLIQEANELMAVLVSSVKTVKSHK